MQRKFILELIDLRLKRRLVMYQLKRQSCDRRDAKPKFHAKTSVNTVVKVEKSADADAVRMKYHQVTFRWKIEKN